MKETVMTDVEKRTVKNLGAIYELIPGRVRFPNS